MQSAEILLHCNIQTRTVPNSRLTHEQTSEEGGGGGVTLECLGFVLREAENPPHEHSCSTRCTERLCTQPKLPRDHGFSLSSEGLNSSRPNGEENELGRTLAPLRLEVSSLTFVFRITTQTGTNTNPKSSQV